MFELGMKLRELRKGKKWTQKRLSELLSISEASISKYEGNLAAPPIELLRSYATLFNISMDELLGVQPSGNLSLHGLTEEQVAILKSLADAFKTSNHIETSQETYALIGKIAVEIARLNRTKL